MRICLRYSKVCVALAALGVIVATLMIAGLPGSVGDTTADRVLNVSPATLSASASARSSSGTAPLAVNFTGSAFDATDNIPAQSGSVSATTQGTVDNATHHYEYVMPDGFIYVYDIDNGFNLVKTIPVPTTAGVRGSVASVVNHALYISYGDSGNGGPRTAARLLRRLAGIRNGQLLAYDLITDRVLWQQTYTFGIDSMAITPDGKTIYVPTGSGTPGGIWHIIDANTGNVTGSIDTGGWGPHNTLISLNGSHVYMGAEHTNNLFVADTSNNTVIGYTGPYNNGVRPFTINGNETLAFVSTTGFLGFSIGDIITGEVLYTVPVQGFPTCCTAASDPSHGISLSPNEKEIYLVDSINSCVHVFDVSGLPGKAPKQVADLHLQNPMTGVETNCAYSCLRDGWIHHSRDGRYAFVGDSGDVIDTTLRKTVATLPAMANTRKEIEIDFQNDVVTWAMNSRVSIGAGGGVISNGLDGQLGKPVNR
jgi:hypothetical protein